jgi:hypothetical protein
MSYDVSVVVAKVRAAKYAGSFEPTIGAAGYANTRKESAAVLTDKQTRVVDRFAALIPKRRRAAFREAVLARLSGRPGDAACVAACIQASLKFVDPTRLQSRGLVALDSHGSVRLSPSSDQSYRFPGGSLAVRGLERRK